jgi:hypothetical protein
VTETITAIPVSATAFTGAELVEMVQSATTVKALLSQFLAYCKDSGHTQTVGDANATIAAGIRIVYLNTALTAARTYTLPAANSAANALGDPIIFIDPLGTITPTNTITFARAGTDTINGATTVVLNAAYTGAVLRTDNVSRWTFTPSSGGGAVASVFGRTGVVVAASGDYGVAQVTGAAALAGSTFTGPVALAADPTIGLQAATKQYVDAVIQGLAIKPTARLATAAALPANTYANGASGVGATLTANAVGILTVDGVATVLNDVILVKSEVSAFKNGLYQVTTAGTAGVAYVLTRHVDMNLAAEFTGAFIPVDNEGTSNPNTMWLNNYTSAFTVGTTAVTFTLLNPAGSGTATNISGGAANQIVKQTAAGATGFITTANNGVLVTDGSGVPTVSSTLPTGLTLSDPRGTANVAISAAGTTQGTATALTNDYNVVTGGTGGVALQTPAQDKWVIVVNKNTVSIFVYPPSGTAIDALANNIPILLAPDQSIIFIGRSATVWDSSIRRLSVQASQVASAYTECFANPSTGVNFEGGFYFAAIGTGAGWSTSTVLPNAITGGACGVLTAACGTVATNVAYMGTGNTLGLTFTFGSGFASYESRLCMVTLSTSTDRYTQYVGFASDTSGAPASGCFFRYTDNVNTGKWQCVTRSGGTETTADSGITVAASSTAMNKFRVEVNAAGSSVNFYYNNALVATNTLNIPTGANRECGFGNFFIKSVGTTNANIFACDYAEAKMAFTAAR